MSDLTKRMADALRDAREDCAATLFHIAEYGDGKDGPGYANQAALLGRIDALLAEHDAQPERGEPVAWRTIYSTGEGTHSHEYNETGDGEPLYLVAQQAAVPPGYVLVPIEPTKQMYIAGLDADGTVFGIYKAMIAAAPGEEAPNTKG